MRSPTQCTSRKPRQTEIRTPRIRNHARPRSYNSDTILANPTRESDPIHQRRIFLPRKERNKLQRRNLAERLQRAENQAPPRLHRKGYIHPNESRNSRIRRPARSISIFISSTENRNRSTSTPSPNRPSPLALILSSSNLGFGFDLRWEPPVLTGGAGLQSSEKERLAIEWALALGISDRRAKNSSTPRKQRQDRGYKQLDQSMAEKALTSQDAGIGPSGRGCILGGMGGSSTPTPVIFRGGRPPREEAACGSSSCSRSWYSYPIAQCYASSRSGCLKLNPSELATFSVSNARKSPLSVRF